MTTIPHTKTPNETTVIARGSRIEIALEAGERWWGGATDDAHAMPYGDVSFTRDLGLALASVDTEEGRPSSQSAPILVSTHGRAIASESSFAYAFDGGRLIAQGEDVLALAAGTTLRDAFLAAADRFFPPSGLTPAIELLTAPQYNPWIELPYRPTQASVLSYAKGILAGGMQPGVLIIDDSWAPDYGTWLFDESRFPDPSAMTQQLHEWGFSVMLWLVPFVSPDSAAFRHLEHAGLLVRDHSGRTAVRRWWNGFSALLDLSHPQAVSWLTEQLDELHARHGIDGFKFDGGDIRDYRNDDLTHAALTPTEMCEAWANIGLRYPFNEFRACWRMGGQPLAQRLQDKPPRWDETGILSLVPEMLAQGMIGHPYVCPDMIGGGEIDAVSRQTEIDQELFVRYAQVAAISPMAQFSITPARVLDAEHLEAVRSALALRTELLPLLMDLAHSAALTGEPVLRPMAYHAPELGNVRDQFFVGPDLFVAPVLKQGAHEREVHIPEGRWATPDGRVITGPTTVQESCTLTTIPRFSRAHAKEGKPE